MHVQNVRINSTYTNNCVYQLAQMVSTKMKLIKNVNHVMKAAQLAQDQMLMTVQAVKMENASTKENALTNAQQDIIVKMANVKNAIKIAKNVTDH